MITQTISNIRDSIITAMQAVIPSFDLSSGTPERDIFVEAPISGQLINLWNGIIYAAKLHAPIIYYQDLSETDINNYCANYNVSPLPATYSTGTVTFYTYNIPSADIIISAGQIVSTTDSTPIQFAVDGNYAMYKNSIANYYNALLGRYELNAQVTSVNAGAQYRAVSGAVIKIEGSIQGISGVTNANIIGGGASTDTVYARLQRVIQKFQGRNMASTQGLKTFITNQVQAVNIIGAGDPEMLRDNGIGGCIDIYIRGETLTSATDSFVVSSIDGIQNIYLVTSTRFRTKYQPVNSIQSVVYNGVSLASTSYILVPDTGILANSTAGFDRVMLTSTGDTSTGYIKVGDRISCTYLYNSLLYTLQNNLTSPQNTYVDRKYLLRHMTPVTINFYAQVTPSAGYTITTVISTIELGVDNVISSLSNNAAVELADIIGGIKNLPGVDNINIKTVSITNIGGGTLTAQGDVLLGRNEYAVTGVCTIVQW